MDCYADFSTGDVVRVKTESLKKFIDIASNNEMKKRYRLCLHDSPDNKLQDMLICMVKGDYARPHKHIDMPESHLIVCGRAAIVLFDDNGKIIDKFVLDNKSGYLIYRVNADIYHTTVLLSDYVIEYEVKPGPFDPNNNIYPNWAPDGSNQEEVNVFLSKVREKIRGDLFDSI